MKKAFTLVEILISVVILSIMVFVLSDVVKNMDVSKNILKKNIRNEHYKQIALKVLYYDILNSKYVNLSQKKNYSLISMQTTNSLYNIPAPYVVWYVSKKDNALMRMEMPQKVTFLSNIRNYYLDKFNENVKIFKIYRYFYKYFIYLDDGKPVYFEMYKGF